MRSIPDERIRLGYLTCSGRQTGLTIQARSSCVWTGPTWTWEPSTLDDLTQRWGEHVTHLDKARLDVRIQPHHSVPTRP